MVFVNGIIDDYTVTAMNGTNFLEEKLRFVYSVWSVADTITTVDRDVYSWQRG